MSEKGVYINARSMVIEGESIDMVTPEGSLHTINSGIVNIKSPSTITINMEVDESDDESDEYDDDKSYKSDKSNKYTPGVHINFSGMKIAGDMTITTILQSHL